MSTYPETKESPNPLTVSRLGDSGRSEIVGVPSRVHKVNATVGALRARDHVQRPVLLFGHLNVTAASAALHVNHFVLSFVVADKRESIVLT
ncbi:hypothetical protein [Streptomyces sp. NPDC048643]|uniref:hypothetical protein n=1 Tax=Streptomyces sp. NPDC048643 TaxID=3155637 RepID=UPI00341B3B5F